MSRRVAALAAPGAATRRDLFGSVSALLLLSAAEAGPAKAAELDGPLLALCDEAVALHARQAAAFEAIDLQPADVDEAEAWESIYDNTPRWHELCAEIAEIPARTPEGMMGKAKVLRRVVALEEPLVASLCRDVLGRAGA